MSSKPQPQKTSIHIPHAAGTKKPCGDRACPDCHPSDTKSLAQDKSVIQNLHQLILTKFSKDPKAIQKAAHLVSDWLRQKNAKK